VATPTRRAVLLTQAIADVKK
jgi:hypothetical protein